MKYVLIITLFSQTTQTGSSVSMHDFDSKESCESARAVWLKQIPRTTDGKFYDIGNSPRVICVPK